MPTLPPAYRDNHATAAKHVCLLHRRQYTCTVVHCIDWHLHLHPFPCAALAPPRHAGDFFTAGFLSAYLQGGSLLQCCSAGCASGCEAVQVGWAVGRLAGLARCCCCCCPPLARPPRCPTPLPHPPAPAPRCRPRAQSWTRRHLAASGPPSRPSSARALRAAARALRCRGCCSRAAAQRRPPALPPSSSSPLLSACWHEGRGDVILATIDHPRSMTDMGRSSTCNGALRPATA